MNKLIQVPESFLRSKGVKNPKLVIYGTAAVITLIVVVVIAKKIKNARAGRWTSRSTQSGMENELGGVSIENTTISKGDAIIISQNLFNAMDRWGTDEDAIIDNLGRCKTKGDLNLVIQTFGIKPYDGTGLADTFLSREIAGVMKNLNGWLRSELSGEDLRKVKDIYNKLEVPF